MTHWAVTVGINQYRRFQPLNYAQQDAQALRNFLVDEAGFTPERCLLLTDSSPSFLGLSTYPDHATLQGWTNRLLQQFLQPGDVLWYFFSGYGVCHDGRDYLLPIDGDPTAIAATGIPLERLYKQLHHLRADGVLVLLDMNRSPGVLSTADVGYQTQQLAAKLGVPTILSCQPGQFSREAAPLGHGLFTTALIESLRYTETQTLAGVEDYLRDRLPELSLHHWRPIQQPVTINPPGREPRLLLPSPAPTAKRPGHAVKLSVGATRPAQPWTMPRPTASRIMGSQAATGETSPDCAPTVMHHWSEPTQSASPVLPNTGSRPTPPRTPAPPAPVPETAPPAATTEPPSDRDRTFWRGFLIWGGIAALLLLVGVLLRNWKAIVPAPAPQSVTHTNPDRTNADAASSPATADTAPNETPTAGVNPDAMASPPTMPGEPSPTATASPSPAPAASPFPSPMPASPTPAAMAGESLLAIARAKIGNTPGQATQYWYAILEASKIPPNHPEYTTAQQEITRWSQEILNVAQQRADQGNFDTAILAAWLVPANQPMYDATQTQLRRWCQQLRPDPMRNPNQYRNALDYCNALPPSG